MEECTWCGGGTLCWVGLRMGMGWTSLNRCHWTEFLRLKRGMVPSIREERAMQTEGRCEVSGIHEASRGQLEECQVVPYCNPKGSVWVCVWDCNVSIGRSQLWDWWGNEAEREEWVSSRPDWTLHVLLKSLDFIVGNYKLKGLKEYKEYREKVNY